MNAQALYVHRETSCYCVIRLSDSGIVLGLEPLDGISGLDSVRRTNGGLGTSSSGDTGTWTSHDAVEVHSVDTDSWVVLDSEIDVFGNTETKVAGLGEVALSQLELLDTETTLQDFLSLWTTDGDVDGNLFVTTDTEGTDGVAGLAVNWSLTGELFQHLSGTGESITGLADTDVEDEFVDPQLTHWVARLRIGHFCRISCG